MVQNTVIATIATNNTSPVINKGAQPPTILLSNTHNVNHGDLSISGDCIISGDLEVGGALIVQGSCLLKDRLKVILDLKRIEEQSLEELLTDEDEDMRKVVKLIYEKGIRDSESIDEKKPS